MKKKVVILSFYLPGIYPGGDDSVVLNLLAPAYLKAALVSDSKLCEEYETKILDIKTTANKEDILKEIEKEIQALLHTLYIFGIMSTQ